jgi:predicted RNA-binding protein YlqC (UPF0109 family)
VADVKEIVEYITRGLVDDPDAVEITEERADDAVVVRVKVAPEDRGKLIGRGGRTIRAIRDVTRAAATRSGLGVSVELVE